MKRDYAKTLYKPTRPDEWNDRLKTAIGGKLPYFFQFAKKKKRNQVEARGTGVVDRLYNLIQIYRFDFNAAALGKFDYRMLMYDENIPYGEKEQELVTRFRKASASLGNVGGDNLYDDDSQYWFLIKNLRKSALEYGSVQYVTDVLIRGLFGEANTKRKAAFWACFGDTVYENLTRNVPARTKLCARCGRRFRINGTSPYCEDCKPLEKIPEVRTAICIVCGEPFVTRDETSGAVCPACKMKEATLDIGYVPGRLIRTCVDCGRPFEVTGRGRPSTRCSKCQDMRNREKVKQWKIKHKKH